MNYKNKYKRFALFVTQACSISCLISHQINDFNTWPKIVLIYKTHRHREQQQFPLEHQGWLYIHTYIHCRAGNNNNFIPCTAMAASQTLYKCWATCHLDSLSVVCFVSGWFIKSLVSQPLLSPGVVLSRIPCRLAIVEIWAGIVYMVTGNCSTDFPAQTIMAGQVVAEEAVPQQRYIVSERIKPRNRGQWGQPNRLRSQ